MASSTKVSRLRLSIAVLSLACEPRSPASSPPPASTAQASSKPSAPGASTRGPASASAGAAKRGSAFVGTVGIVDVPRQGSPALLAAVRVAGHEGYDRVVFEFQGGVPGYHVEYIDRPVRDCGAGDPRPIAGDAWLEIRFYPANAHDEQGRPTVPARELRPNLANVLEVERTCDFEAVVTWVLGTKSPKRYRVLELADPPRLALDVQN